MSGSVRLPFFIALAVGALGAACAQTTLETQTRHQATIQARLELADRDNAIRREKMDRMFEEAGCTESLSHQEVKRARGANILCTDPGETGAVIVVCAHYDGSGAGQAAADNWSGASLLPSLFEDIKWKPRKHTFRFIAFAGEERGLLGSQYYVKQLSKEERAKIVAVVNLDTLGLSETKLWLNHSDKRLANLLSAVANSLKLPLAVMNVDQVGTSDSQSFVARKIPSIDIHSVTAETLGRLHTKQDTVAALDAEAYYRSYKLVSTYLVLLDQAL
jgi:Iap family predicted aminopeptidase